jgi:hypothetical protein
MNLHKQLAIVLSCSLLLPLHGNAADWEVSDRTLSSLEGGALLITLPEPVFSITREEVDEGLLPIGRMMSVASFREDAEYISEPLDALLQDPEFWTDAAQAFAARIADRPNLAALTVEAQPEQAPADLVRRLLAYPGTGSWILTPSVSMTDDLRSVQVTIDARLYRTVGARAPRRLYRRSFTYLTAPVGPGNRSDLFTQWQRGDGALLKAEILSVMGEIADLVLDDIDADLTDRHARTVSFVIDFGNAVAVRDSRIVRETPSRLIVEDEEHGVESWPFVTVERVED